jgi:hypothetical protein
MDPAKLIGDVLAAWARQGCALPVRDAYVLAEIAVAVTTKQSIKPTTAPDAPWSDDPRSEGMGA